MSSNATSPTTGRILRSHVKKPSTDDSSKEKEQVKSPPTETEKDKKKRKSKASSSSQSSITSSTEAEKEETTVDLKSNTTKPNKKKRRITARAAHSDGEQEFVELDDPKSKVYPLHTQSSLLHYNDTYRIRP